MKTREEEKRKIEFIEIDEIDIDSVALKKFITCERRERNNKTACSESESDPSDLEEEEIKKRIRELLKEARERKLKNWEIRSFVWGTTEFVTTPDLKRLITCHHYYFKERGNGRNGRRK